MRTYKNALETLESIKGMEADSKVEIEEDFDDGYLIVKVPVNFYHSWLNPTIEYRNEDEEEDDWDDEEDLDLEDTE